MTYCGSRGAPSAWSLPHQTSPTARQVRFDDCFCLLFARWNSSSALRKEVSDVVISRQVKFSFCKCELKVFVALSSPSSCLKAREDNKMWITTTTTAKRTRVSNETHSSWGSAIMRWWQWDALPFFLRQSQLACRYARGKRSTRWNSGTNLGFSESR